MWRQHCFDPIKHQLIPSLLNLLDQDREGNKQDKALVRNMVQSYIEFGNLTNRHLKSNPISYRQGRT